MLEYRNHASMRNGIEQVDAEEKMLKVCPIVSKINYKETTMDKLKNDGFSKVEADAMLHTLRDMAHDGKTISEEIHLKVAAFIAGRQYRSVTEAPNQCAMAGRMHHDK